MTFQAGYRSTQGFTTKLPDSTIRKIYEGLDRGEHGKAIAQALGISYETVRRYRKVRKPTPVEG